MGQKPYSLQPLCWLRETEDIYMVVNWKQWSDHMQHDSGQYLIDCSSDTITKILNREFIDCILSGWIKKYNSSITIIMCQDGSYWTMVRYFIWLGTSHKLIVSRKCLRLLPVQQKIQLFIFISHYIKSCKLLIIFSSVYNNFLYTVT